MRKLTPYNILKGIRYLKHFGPKEFWVRLQERMEPEQVPYGPWYEHYRPREEELSRQRRAVWRQPVTFSVVVPVYETRPVFLQAMIDSVLNQTYPHWELCLVNASPDNAGVLGVLAGLPAKDSRLRVISLKENLGIAGNTNAGIAAAKGDFIALLDHDDALSPAALYALANYLEHHPDTGLIYTDEDKISEDGQTHFQPHLKPDFNLDLLRSNNYICHLLAVQRDVAQEAGGFDPSFEGAQDYDFIFRCVDVTRIRGLSIGHVPEILYHWRVSASSTADNPASKLYAYEAGRRAIARDLARTNTPGEVALKKDYGFYRVTYPPRQEDLISIIIPNKDQADTLKRCITSIRERSTWQNYELIIVENNSTDPKTFEYYRSIAARDCRIVTWEGSGFNYAALNNFGFAHARGRYILCLNNDTQVITPGWMEELLGVCQRPEVGIVGARLYYPDDTIQHAGIVVGIGGIAASMFTDLPRARSGYLHKAQLMQDLSAVTAACMMVRRDVWQRLNGFEEQLRVAFNDVDFCLRCRQAGYLVVYDPYAELYHHESKSRGTEDTRQKVHRFQQEIEFMRTRWETLLKEGDPCYNKNFSRNQWNYTLRPGARMDL